MLPPDYHMHTPLCGHACGEPVAYAARAVAVGLSEIGFSDHAPMVRDGFDDWRMRQGQLDTYVALVEHARQTYPQLSIKLALEVDYLPGEEAWIGELADRYPWDYLIGSVHYFDSTWAIDNPDQQAQWRERDPDAVWRTYIERLIQAAQTGLFDILGHIDLCKKFGFYAREDLLPLWDQLLTVAREKAIAIEINTAGLHKPCREMYPSRKLLEHAFHRDVAITLGSDAHAPEEVGRDWKQALALAKAVGYRHSLRLSQRQREWVPL